MMDKQSANGFQTKANEGGVQRKQLPYSVETPYGFHLDLDFLKYVDDIEKGNTIKRVHIQRRVKGPPKFSTLPRNFSLPAPGARPVPKEKDTTWSGTSTLGPKPKSRVTEVQQIFDFRASDGGTSSRGTSSAGTSYVSAKPRDEGTAGAQGIDEQTVGIQNRPNLLRASSMPITLQQRKGSDSSSPDRILGTPENGSTENMFRPSPDITERRTVPQDRTGLHQQITVALKRVRELEEQVKTIPELKAQILSLKTEREQLLLQLQAQAQAQVSNSSIAPSSDAATHTQPQGHRLKQGFNLILNTQPSGGLDASGPEKAMAEKDRVSQKDKVTDQESIKTESLQRQTQPLEKSDMPKETTGSSVEHAGKKLSLEIAGQELTSLRMALKDAEISQVQDGSAATEGKIEESGGVPTLHEKLVTLEAKLTQASHELERTNSLLKEQMADNKVKEEKILQLSEGMRVEVCTTEPQSRPRRQSIDTGTETEKVDVINRETETELPGTVDQGTDTEKICIEVCVPKPRAGSAEQGKEMSRVDIQVQVTEIDAEVATASPPRPRANSMERGTVTDRVATQDQTTETPIATRVNQVTETEGETVTDHPQRPRASSVDRGTITERVNTVDRVTETDVAQRTDQHTETEGPRRQDDNPGSHAEAESPGRESERVEDATVVSESEERKKREEYMAVVVVTESSAAVIEGVSDKAIPVEGHTSPLETEEKGASNDEISPSQSDSEMNETTSMESIETEIHQATFMTETQIVCATFKNTAITDTVIIVEPESESVKTLVPVRPQRGRRPSAEQAQPSQPSLPQIQAAPVRPRRGSSDVQGQQAEAKTQPQVEAQPETKVQALVEAQPEPKVQALVEVLPETKVQGLVEVLPETKVQALVEVLPETKTQPKVEVQPEMTTEPQVEVKQETRTQPQVEVQPEMITQALVEVKPETKTRPHVEEQPQPQPKPDSPSPAQLSEPQVKQVSSTRPQGENATKAKRPKDQTPSSKEVQTRPKSIQAQPQSQTSATRRDSKELKGSQRLSGVSQPSRRGSSEAQTRPTRQGSTEVQSQSRRSSGETQPPLKDASETQSLRRGSTEAAQHRVSGEAQTSRRGSSESPTSPAALGQVVTRLTGLLGEQWAQLGSSSGVQQTAGQQESPSTQKQTAGKRAEAGKGASAKPAGKATPAATTGKPAGKPGPSKMSSIQSQLVSSLSVLSAFYSPGQKSGAASKQQEQGLKSIMKKNGVADKQGNKGAKKNLKFVGVNGGYETTSSEESSGDEKSKLEAVEAVEAEEEEEDSSEPEVEKAEEKPAEEEGKEAAEAEEKEAEKEVLSLEGGGATAAAEEIQLGLLDPESSQEILDDEGRKVDKGFIDACLYVKDRMEEVSSPDKEMRQVLVVLYKEWFKVSSQKDSQADTVRLYLRQVGLTTPTLLPYVVNLTDGNGNMALHYSVSHSNFPVVKLLLDTGLCETDNVNKAGYTPVMLVALTAAETPDELEVGQQLLKLGDIDARSRQTGQTALMLAVSHGRVAMVKLLLSCGADVNAQDREGSTALMCASEHGHTHIVRLLLETGRCNAGLADKKGQTAQSAAEAGSHQEIIELLKAHADGRPVAAAPL